MSETTDAETELRTAYKRLVDEVGQPDAINALEDLASEARECQMFDQEFTVDASAEPAEPDADDHEFDTDERLCVEANEDGDPTVDGNLAAHDVLGEVELAEIDDGWLVLEGDTYDAKGHIKAIDYQYREFDGDRKVWLVDEEKIEELHGKLNAGGFLFVDARGESEPEGPDPADELRDYIDTLSEGDRIEVEYEMKNGNGTNSKEGEVRETRLPEEEEFVDVPALRFERDDEQRMYVRPDEYGKLALYTAMSHAPFVGDVEAIEVVGGDA